MIRSIAVVVAAGALLAGCSAPSRTASAQDSTKLTDWGVVEFAANTPKHLRLAGKDCIFTVASLGDGNLRIIIKTKENVGKGDAPPGIPADAPIETTLTMTNRSGTEINGYVGHKPVRFTPILKT
jgi:hypothetical protein